LYGSAKNLFEMASMNFKEQTSNCKKFTEFNPQKDKVLKLDQKKCLLFIGIQSMTHYQSPRLVWSLLQPVLQRVALSLRIFFTYYPESKVFHEETVDGQI